MKILHISPSYFPAFKYGGPIQSVHLLNKYLAKKGNIVDVITTNAGLINNDAIVLNKWVNVDNVRVKYLKFLGYEHYNFSIPLSIELSRIISNYDIIHITAVWNYPVLAGSFFSLIKKKPYIISPRGTIYKETIELNSSFLKKTYFQLVAKNYLNKAAAIHFTTEDESEKVKDYLKLKSDSFVVSNGIELDKISKSLCKDNSDYPVEHNDNNKYFLILGRIHKKKGFDILIPSFSRLCKDYDLKLIIAGPDNEGYKSEVEQLIKKENIEDRVSFTGLLDEKKWQLYKNALAFVLPSYSENFGMAVVEAMACGTPVIISNKVGIYREVEEAKAGIVVETTIDSLYKGMKQLIESKDKQKAIAASGRKLIKERYDIENAANQMIKAYGEIIRKHDAK